MDVISNIKSTANRTTVGALPIDQRYDNALTREYEYARTDEGIPTIKALLDASYVSSLRKWVDSACQGKRGYYQKVVIEILKIPRRRELIVWINCQGLDSCPPLPNLSQRLISLRLTGQPDVSLEVFLASCPSYVEELSFFENTGIYMLSSKMVPPSIKKLSLSGCPNLVSFAGEFTVANLRLSNIAGRSLAILKDNFPQLCILSLSANANLESIEVSENFELSRLDILGDHNKLTKIPSFSRVKAMDISSSNLASISDYSWGYDTKDGFKCNEDAFVELVINHHKQNSPAATLKLIEMTEHILLTSDHQKYASLCLMALIDPVPPSPRSFSEAELLLGQLFLEGKLINSDYEKAQKFFRSALEREKYPEKKEALQQRIESLERDYFYAFYRKARLISNLEGETNLLPELSNHIFSMGFSAMKKPH
ncbi:MAG: hypothetical protein K0R08_1871 [Solimicrobium sp.]|jgi:hypothetical protein|nr:hypothetical protein [Solimicrobium sp.]